MRISYRRKIGTRLGYGFMVVVGFAVLLGVVALLKMRTMAGLTRDLYEHPLTVSNAIRDIRGDALTIHHLIKDVILSSDQQQIQDIQNQISLREQNVLQSFNILTERYLGDTAEVDTVRKAFLEWGPIRGEIFTQVQEGNKDAAIQIDQGRDDRQILLIFEGLQVISDFAMHKANFFYNKAQKTERLYFWILSGMVVLVSAAGLWIGFRITRSITGPIRYVIEQIHTVAGGNLNHKINLDSRDEIGVLAQAFDDMTTSLEKITASRNELDAANQQLGASNQQLQANEQQLRAANQQLRASEQYRESIITSVPGVVFQLHMDVKGAFSIVYMSQQAESIIGHPMDILTQSDCFFDIIHPLDVDGFKLSIRDSAQTLMPWELEFRIFDKNGRLAWLKGKSVPQQMADNSIVWNGIIIDITDRKQDEAKLIASEERYRVVADNTYDWEFWIDSDGRYIYLSPSCLRITGYTSEQFKTDPDLLKAILHPEDKLSYQTHLTECRTEHLRGMLEFRIIHKDGQVRWLEHLCQPIFDKDGKWIGVRGSNRDITARKQAEELRRQSEAFIRLVMDNLPIGIAVNSVDPAVTFSYMNDNFPKLYRTTREALVNPDCFWDAVYEEPDFRARIKKQVLEDCASGDPARMKWADVPIVREGQETRFITATNTPIPDKQLVISCVWDVTDRKLAQEALLQSEERFHLLFEQAPLGYQSLNGEGHFIEVNQAWLDTLGYSRQEVVGKWFGDFLAPEYVEAFRQRFPVFKAAGKIHSEFQMLHKNGQRRTISFEGRIGYEPNGSFRQTHCILSDITERRKTEEALRREQELVSRIMETSPVGITAVNRHGEITFANACAEKIFGLSRDKATQRSYNAPDWQITDYAGNPVPDGELPFQKVMTTGKPVYNVQHAIGRPDGQRILLSVNATPLFSDAGKFEGMVATIEDVTEHKKAEAALKESEARFRTLFNAMSEGVALHELITGTNNKAIDYRIVDVNPAYVVHTGLGITEVRNRLASDLYKTGVPPYLDLYAHVAQTGAPMYFETYFSPLQKYFDISVFSPKPGWFATVFNDITLRRQTQQELRASEEKFMKAFRGSPVLMAISTIEEGRFIEVNDAALETLNYERQEVIDKTALELHLYADSQQRDKLVQKLRQEGFARNLEITLQDRMGQPHYCLCSAEVIELQNTQYMLTIINDITERKKAEEVMQLHQANMAHLLRLGELGEMASGMAHEINQPLCAIENYAQACLRLMETKPDIARLAEAIKDIRDQAERAGKIVHRVKGLVRKKPPQFEFVQMRDIIEESISLISTEARKRNVEIFTDVPDNIAPVYADLILIEQVVINLLRNGLEAMDGPQIQKKKLTIHVKSGSNEMIEVAVSDTGCGIPEANMKKIFESFFSTKTDGLGVGLPLSKAIIESHSGQIWGTVNPVGGTTFHFTLPTRSRDNEA